MSDDIDLRHPLLPEDRYDAVIEKIELKFGTTIFLGICYRIPFRGEDFHVWDDLALAAPNDSQGYARTVEGKARLRQIFFACGEQLPHKINRLDIDDALIGRELFVCIRNRMSWGQLQSKVVEIVGKARQPVPPPIV